MAEWFWWFMDSWWSTGVACVCVLVLLGVALYKIHEVEQLRAERDTPSLYELMRRERRRK